MANSKIIRTGRQRWKTAYRAAILENNTKVIAMRIADAEDMIVSRARDLFTLTGMDAEVERDELEDALYALRALRSATNHTCEAA